MTGRTAPRAEAAITRPHSIAPTSLTQTALPLPLTLSRTALAGRGMASKQGRPSRSA